MDLQQATIQWREKKAAMGRAYELWIDRREELAACKTEYGRMEAQHATHVAQAIYEAARDEATAARIAMTDLASTIASRG